MPLSAADAVLQRFLQQQQLPAQYLEAIDGWYRPLASEIARLRQQCQRPLVLGVQGAQGTGKSTLAELLAVLLGSEHNLSVACLSLDDFYLSRADRQRLA